MSSENSIAFEEGQVLLFDKPQYWTSFDLVNKIRIIIRSALHVKKLKVGHAGTLDPLASGLMIVCTGRATRRINEFSVMDKEYMATLRAGATTPSYDLETGTDGIFATDHITREMVLKTLKTFLGEKKQVPPLHSAKMIEGKRAYEYARKGISKNLEPAIVNFRELELIDFAIPDIKIRIVCSKGTYIRSFARDFGDALKSGCYLSALTRTAIGPYKLTDAYTLEKFEDFLEQLQQN